jgi:hypothetical protein
MPHLWEQYLEPTPLNRLLLAEMWECLNAESKAGLLERLMGGFGHRFIPEALVHKALTEPQPYLRYLAAKSGVWKSGPRTPALIPENVTPAERIAAMRTSLGGYDAAVDDKLRADPSPLVRAAVHCRELRSNDYSWMLSASQVERLVFIAGEISVSGDFLTDFVRSAIGHVSENELQEFLTEYCCSTHTKSYYGMEATGDAMTDFTAKGWFEKVWELVGTVPQPVYMPVLWYFPTQTMMWEIPDAVISRVDDNLLALVLRRSDADLPALRKRVAERPTDFGEKTREAAEAWPQCKAAGASKDPLVLLAARVDQLYAKVDEAVQKKRGLFG